ncbi:MAG: pyridoxal-phosphate dependent enzyme [Methylomonas sp.]|jgi:1-aminocyclopropane-1-carboxylate deaminase
MTHPHLAALQAKLAASPLQRISEPLIDHAGLELWIKRDDLLHPVISGNKWRKLKYILDHALANNTRRLISMGGAYSNHLHALAYAGLNLSIETAAYIRGERPALLNPTLTDLQAFGMEMRFISRQEYRQLRQFKLNDSLPALKAGEYWLPEGGATDLALQGVIEGVAEIPIEYDVLAAACGSGATLAGMISAAPPHALVLGIAALKAPFLAHDVAQLLGNRAMLRDNWRIIPDYHCGGFAASTPELLRFIRDFENRHAIPLEPVYTGKMMYAVYDLIAGGFFSPGRRLVVIHTGGLQGKR